MSFEAGPANPAPFSVGIHLQPQFDVIELLPLAAAEKLRALRQRASDAHALCVPFAEQHELSMERIGAENRLRELVGHPQDFGHNLPPDDRRVVVQQRLVDKLANDLQRLRERTEARAAAWQAASGALANVETWLKFGKPSGVLLHDYDGSTPTLNKNETVLDGIARLRHRGRELHADFARVEAAAYPAAEARAVAMAQIEALAQRGALDTSGCVEHLEPIRFPTKSVQALVHNSNSPGAVAFAEVIDAEAVIAHLLRPQLIAAVEASIAADADEPNALGQAEREKRAAVIAQDLLICQRGESELAWRAQSEGLPVEHRADIDPCALLGVVLVTAPRATEAPGTTPGLSWPWRG